MANFQEQFYRTFIESDRYLTFLEGLKTTVIISFFALVIGIIVGVILAVIKVYNCRSIRSGVLRSLMLVLQRLTDLYLLIFRGTPVVVQLMILFYVIMINVQSGVVVAIIGFGINSGAYVCEIVRAGIMSIDKGQTEAGRSLGLSESQTMRLVILPQAVKNVLPPLFNEFITLLKETSVAGYITVVDLTKAGDLVRSRTMQAFFPLLAVALIYLVLVMGLTTIQGILERRLQKGDRR